MVFDYKNLLGVLFDLNLKDFWTWVIWERFWNFRWKM